MTDPLDNIVKDTKNPLYQTQTQEFINKLTMVDNTNLKVDDEYYTFSQTSYNHFPMKVKFLETETITHTNPHDPTESYTEYKYKTEPPIPNDWMVRGLYIYDKNKVSSVPVTNTPQQKTGGKTRKQKNKKIKKQKNKKTKKQKNKKTKKIIYLLFVKIKYII